jgi:beta-N-acetylhexosaminidase
LSGTVQEAIGELIIGRVPGTELDEGTRHCLKTGTMGGITIFKENVASQEQLMDLCDSVRKVSWHQALIAVDQEGGPVQRLDEIVSPLPSMMALGNLDDMERLKLITCLSGKQLRLLGFNCVFAPVLDVNTNPQNPIIGTRAFGDDPEQVARMGAAVMRSYLDAGVLPVAKHFPGHGDTSLDSHQALPRLTHDRRRLDSIELAPFCENLLTTPALLVAHLVVECLGEEEVPATMSYAVTTRLLKEELGYQNLVVSDDMLMKAITLKWGLAEASVRALAAGVDLLLVLTGAEDAMAVHRAILEAVANGKLSEQRIFDACRARNAALKKLPSHEEVERGRRLSALRRSVSASESLLLETSASAISRRGGNTFLVFSSQRPVHFFVPKSDRYRFDFVKALAAEIPALSGRLVEHRYSLCPDRQEIEDLAGRSGEHCVLVSFRAALNPGQIELAARLRSSSVVRLLVAADVPYDLDMIAGWEDAAALFDPSNLAVRAFARLVARELESSSLCSEGV